MYDKQIEALARRAARRTSDVEFLAETIGGGYTAPPAPRRTIIDPQSGESVRVRYNPQTDVTMESSAAFRPTTATRELDSRRDANPTGERRYRRRYAGRYID